MMEVSGQLHVPGAFPLETVNQGLSEEQLVPSFRLMFAAAMSTLSLSVLVISKG